MMEVRTTVFDSYELFLETINGLSRQEIDFMISLNKDLRSYSQRESFWGDLIRLSFGITQQQNSTRDDYIMMAILFEIKDNDCVDVTNIIKSFRQAEIEALKEGKVMKHFITDTYIMNVRREYLPNEIFKARTPQGALLKEYRLLLLSSQMSDLIDMHKAGKIDITDHLKNPHDWMREITLPKIM